MLKIDILTLFPETFIGAFDFSIIKRAKEKGIVEINIHNLRDWSTDKYKSVDDHPYGGGAGMVMRVDVLDRALQSLNNQAPITNNQISSSQNNKSKTILTDAGGKQFNEMMAQEWSKLEHLIFIAGHYEGVDARVREHLADEAVSIGPYVMSGGELPIAVMIDTVVRLLPGALGNEDSLKEESHNEEGVGEYPQYTRPEEYNGWKVPEVLMSGNHKEIEKWRKEKQTINK